MVQYLINNENLEVDNLVTIPNQNLGIYQNPLPQHPTNNICLSLTVVTWVGLRLPWFLYPRAVDFTSHDTTCPWDLPVDRFRVCYLRACGVLFACAQVRLLDRMLTMLGEVGRLLMYSLSACKVGRTFHLHADPDIFLSLCLMQGSNPRINILASCCIVL